MVSSPERKLVVVGAGITGLTLAAELSAKFKDRVVLIERENFLGGLASSMHKDGLQYDLGSHRFHRSVPPEIISYIENDLGVSLLKRPRRGRLHIATTGKLIPYPPNIFCLVKAFALKETIKFAFSYFKNLIIPAKTQGDNFESVMTRKGGKKIYESFFKNYAEKLWGKKACEISADMADRKRSLGCFKTTVARLFNVNDYYFYPRKGIGEIANKLKEIIIRNKGRIVKVAEVESIFLKDNSVEKIIIKSHRQGQEEIYTDIFVSTIPIDDIFKLITIGKKVSCDLQWRAVRLLYIVIDEKIKSLSETYYFPDLAMFVGRVSEVKKYSPGLNSSLKGSLLTIEVPCSRGDKIWQMRDEEFLDCCLKDLVKVGIVEEKSYPVSYFSLNLDKSYPVYDLPWRDNFFKVYNEIEKIKNMFTVGRKGLFLHCNIDHCIVQGKELAKLILENKWQDKDSWRQKVLEFMKFSARD